MTKVLSTLTFMLLLIACGASYGQASAVERAIESKGIIYKFEHAINVNAVSNGYGLGYQWGEIKTYYKTDYYCVDLVRVFDPRERRQNKNIALRFNSLSSSFKYGKQSDVFVARLSKGQRKYLTDRAKRKGVSIGYDLAVGASLGLAKPYHLELIYSRETGSTTQYQVKSEPYSVANAKKFLNYDEIYGGAPWVDGLEKTSVIPGAHLKSSVFFSVGQYDKIVKNIETGILLDMFVRKVPLMVQTEEVSNRPYLMNLFIKLQLGQRKN
jgi:hypothetical protein